MIVYIGHFLSEKIVADRGIPFRNAAGSNRIFRIASALHKSGKEIEIISPGISLRSKPLLKESCRSQLETAGGIDIFYAETSSILFVNLMTSTLSVIRRIRYHQKSGNLSGAIIYNFSLEFLLVAVYLKLFTRVTIINNVEDVSVPRFNDIRRGKEVRWGQQIIFSICLKIIARLSDGFIIPTRKFLNYLPISGRRYALVTGCIDTVNVSSFICNQPLRILFSGKIDFEQGINILIEALIGLDKSFLDRIDVKICGDGAKTDWLIDKLAEAGLNNLAYKGFLSDKEYKILLAETDICLVLQNPKGRYMNFKTPSKFFEYYSNGKYVVSSLVGDYEDLPENSFKVVEPYNSDTLKSILQDCINNIYHIESARQKAYNFAKENFNYNQVGLILIEKLGL